MTLKINFDKFDRKITSISKSFLFIVDEALKETSEQALKTIVKRTRSKNEDRNGLQFVKYSTSYITSKRKAGASAKVNLTSAGTTRGRGRTGSLKGNKQGGSMMNSLTTEKVNHERYRITASRGIELEKLRAHVRGEGNLPQRDPMGFTDKEDKLLSGRVVRQVTKKIKEIGRK